MSSVLLGHDQAVADWVGQLNGKAFSPPFTAIGVINKQGALTGGYVFTSYNQDGIEVSIAGRGVVARDPCRAMARYVFSDLGCVRLVAHTRRSNKAIRRLMPRLGFRFEGTCRRFYGDEDAFQYSLTKDDLGAFVAKWRL